MSTLGITIGIGEGWDKAAVVAAARMRNATGIDCVVCDRIPQLPEGWSPSWGKAWLFDLVPARFDRLLIFDADIVAVRKWQLPDAPGFYAVRELGSNPSRTNEQLAYQLTDYFNGGLFIIDREHADRLAAVRDYGPRYGTWLEQTALNKVFADVFRALPSQLNWLLENETSGLRGAIDSGAINLHLAGTKDPREILAMQQKIEETIP
jgi:hypothetical protein